MGGGGGEMATMNQYTCIDRRIDGIVVGAYLLYTTET